MRIFGGPPTLARHSGLAPSAAAVHGVAARAVERGLDLDGRPWADGFEMRCWGLRRVDLGNYNKGTLAGWGVDYRDPTADRRVVKFCLNIPETEYILDGEPRSLQRRAFATRLPPEVLAEARKGSQAAAWSLGMDAAQERMAVELESLEACREAAAIIDLPRLRAAMDAWPAADRADPETARLYRNVVLRSVSAGHFLRRVSGSNA